MKRITMFLLAVMMSVVMIPTGVFAAKVDIDVPDVNIEGPEGYEPLQVEIKVKNDISKLGSYGNDMYYSYYLSKDSDADIPLPDSRYTGMTGQGEDSYSINFTKPTSATYEIWENNYLNFFGCDVAFYRVTVDVTAVPGTNRLQAKHTVVAYSSSADKLSSTTISDGIPVCTFTYDEYKEVSLPININKQVDNSSGKKGKFEFSVKDQTPRTKQKSILYAIVPGSGNTVQNDGETEVDPTLMTVTLNGAGSILSEPLTFTSPGYYSFSITENDNEDYIKKTEGYILDVYVASSGTNMKLSWRIYNVKGEDSSELVTTGEGDEIPEMTFINEEIPTDDPEEPSDDEDVNQEDEEDQSDDEDKSDDGDKDTKADKSDNADKNTPSTGDEIALMMLLIMLAASGLVTATALYRKNR